jgi:hypothetical protein
MAPPRFAPAHLVSLLVAFSSCIASCGSSNNYGEAYPYDTAYTGSELGYYPYSMDTYPDASGEFLTLVPSSSDGGPDAALGTQRADAGSSGVPELLDKTARAANDINSGIQATLGPIKDILKTKPAKRGNTVTFGPVDRGSAAYQLVMYRFSASEKRYAWMLEARAVSGTSSDFVLVAGGSIQVGDTPGLGRGVLGADYDAQSSVDTSVHAKGRLYLGFADDSTTKILHFVLAGFTPDPQVVAPLDATAIGWHRPDANDVRIALNTNLLGPASSAAETVVIKLHWRKDIGARADAIATGGDVPQGNGLLVSTCVPATLDSASASTSEKLCSTSGNDCTQISGPQEITCPNGLGTVDAPMADPTAVDPPQSVPEVPDAPSDIPTISGG